MSRGDWSSDVCSSDLILCVCVRVCVCACVHVRVRVCVCVGEAGGKRSARAAAQYTTQVCVEDRHKLYTKHHRQSRQRYNLPHDICNILLSQPRISGQNLEPQATYKCVHQTGEYKSHGMRSRNTWAKTRSMHKGHAGAQYSMDLHKCAGLSRS